VFGLTTEQIIALAAVGSVALALVLAVITGYYATQAKRQADANKAQVEASREQVLASNRQAQAAQNTLTLLLEEKEQQRGIDRFTVQFQLEAAIQMVEDWQKRLDKESYDLPEIIEMPPANFLSAIQNADRVDQVVAGYMGAALLFMQKAQTDAQIMRDRDDPSQYQNSPMAMSLTSDTRDRLQQRAGYNLNVARFKLLSARTRFEAITNKALHRVLPLGEAD
jgi:hypothetical protein